MDNLKLYNDARVVPDEAKKQISAGRLKGFTDINPMWRIKRLTEMFGPCGAGWWYEITDKRLVEDRITNQTSAFMDILLYFINPETGVQSHGIPGTGGSNFVAQERNGPYMSDECFKMALTDAISVAAKALGIGADVYFEKDRSKYDAGSPPGSQQGIRSQNDQEHDMYFRCEKCGEILKTYFGADGKAVSLRKHAAGSKTKFGQVLCINCINAISARETEDEKPG